MFKLIHNFSKFDSFKKKYEYMLVIKFMHQYRKRSTRNINSDQLHKNQVITNFRLVWSEESIWIYTNLGINSKVKLNLITTIA